IESPAFGVCGDPSEGPDLSKPGQVCILDRQRDLKMMTGNGFVIDGALQSELRHVTHAARILKHPGPRAVRRGAVIAGRGGVFNKRRKWLRDDFRFRTKVE